MKKIVLMLGVVLVSVYAVPARRAATSWSPWANNNGKIPADSQYKGTLFRLSHNYPSVAGNKRTLPPWQQAINGGTIDTSNARRYADALKRYVGPDMRALLGDYSRWDASARHWYNEPWLGDSLREAIHGMYVGNDYLPADQYPHTGLTKPFSTYVLTYYDETGGQTLFNVWGQTAQKPNADTKSMQFREGGIVVKLAFTTANGDVWPVMRGARKWPVFITTNATTGDHPKPRVDSISLFQIDIIVKDTHSAPKTGWVFTTLVFDNRHTGDLWDQMVPLGAQWGNDPGVNSAVQPAPPLLENWINPQAPAYAKTTLGWGGRLSGPNDGAVNDAAVAVGTGYDTLKNVPISSCMSCHSSAEWKMKSFLLPSPTYPPKVVGSDYLVVPAIGGPLWMKWYQNRLGTQPMDAGTAAADFDMVFAFKSLPLWQYATTGIKANVYDVRSLNGMRRRTNQYNGMPIPAPMSR